ncbi:MAG: hypothetical protein ACJ75B_06655 [Flavisolibacter sp.]
MKMSYLDSKYCSGPWYPLGEYKLEGNYADFISINDSPGWLGWYPNLRLLYAGRTTGNPGDTKEPRISPLHWFNRGGALNVPPF